MAVFPGAERARQMVPEWIINSPLPLRSFPLPRLWPQVSLPLGVVPEGFNAVLLSQLHASRSPGLEDVSPPLLSWSVSKAEALWGHGRESKGVIGPSERMFRGNSPYKEEAQSLKFAKRHSAGCPPSFPNAVGHKNQSLGVFKWRSPH